MPLKGVECGFNFDTCIYCYSQPDLEKQRVSADEQTLVLPSQRGAVGTPIIFLLAALEVSALRGDTARKNYFLCTGFHLFISSLALPPCTSDFVCWMFPFCPCPHNELL